MSKVMQMFAASDEDWHWEMPVARAAVVDACEPKRQFSVDKARAMPSVQDYADTRCVEVERGHGPLENDKAT